MPPWSRNSTAASHSLEEEAAELARLVGGFTINQEAETQAARPAQRKLLATSMRTKPALPSAERAAPSAALSRKAGGARLALAAPAEGDWDEF